MITALLITFNEEKHIDDVIENIGFCDEIIIVDSYSTDSTIEKIKKYPKVRLILREFSNYTDQKQFALEQATNEWIIFLDADERITPKLKEEIKKEIQTKNPASAYYFRRTFMFKDKKLRFSGWQTDKNYRLFKKDKVHFTKDRIVHETLVVDGKSKTLKNKLIHYSFSDYEEYKNKMIKYGKMKALESYRLGKKAKWYHLLFRPLWKFCNHFFLRLGVLDGEKGIIICYLNALSVHSRFKELRRLNNQ